MPHFDDQHVDLVRNGSYLVLRQLEQDVFGFWKGLAQATESRAQRDWLAAKLVGRWPSGAPLSLAPERDRPDLADVDDFGYAHDREGLRCPLGAHVRRANPRDAQLSDDPALATRMARQHRILRRSRPYGAPLHASFDVDALLARGDDGVARGLMFGCFNADPSRQFELIQEAWLHNPCFAHLRDEVDPLLRVGEPGSFTVQARPRPQHFHGLARAVTVRGAAYLFLPSVPALRFLAAHANQRFNNEGGARDVAL
ncbi:MAG TPA: hypothetical protein VFX59_08090 [Polyangiales bacterium]|nr:hypothetical protein [Polyangiales bacterium]